MTRQHHNDTWTTRNDSSKVAIALAETEHAQRGWDEGPRPKELGLPISGPQSLGLGPGPIPTMAEHEEI